MFISRQTPLGSKTREGSLRILFVVVVVRPPVVPSGSITKLGSDMLLKSGSRGSRTLDVLGWLLVNSVPKV